MPDGAYFPLGAGFALWRRAALMDCRPGCGACCIAPSLSSPLPGLPGGKPAGVPCPHLTPDLRCELFLHPDRPACCGGLQASPDMCGSDRDHALIWLARLEVLTAPEASD